MDHIYPKYNNNYYFVIIIRAKIFDSYFQKYFLQGFQSLNSIFHLNG
jgi:hypothetical protein